MNTIINKSLKSLLIAAMAMGSLAACSNDEDPVLSALSTPSTELVSATVHTLSFKWSEVANATQYAYELKDPNGDVVSGDVTTETSASFSDLNDGTTYTLDVWAYAKAYSDQYERSLVGSFQGTTVATKTLAAPANLTADSKGTTISWDAVEHADGYGYIVDNSKDTIYVTKTSVALKGYDGGEHSIEVFGYSNNEEYPRAESSSITFVITKQLLWSRSGNITRYDGTSGTATMECYDDGTYKVLSWFGVEGYDLEFSVNGTLMDVTSNYSPYNYYGYDYYWVETTSASKGSYLCPAYSYFYSTFGYVYFYIWDSGDFSGTSGYDIFESQITADSFVGTYSDESFQWYNDAWSSWGTTDVTVTKTNSKTLKFAGVAWNSSDPWTATLEFGSDGYATGKITFKGGQTYSTWYTLGTYTSDSGDVTATFDENLNITISDYAFWYGGYAYYYMYSVLTRK